ncbi:hypothetical protein LCGC14_3115030 [marine sediment metagenome]|uniref:Uncharacterized protein n=1 Tax=marine sediment metagenome TaxID=412755 RepID=A0A0F8YBD8_9ZZZZ
MSRKWKQGDWEIHLNTTGATTGVGWCLRHTACGNEKGYEEDDKGHCSCSNGVCYHCKVEVPDEVKGFFELVKWKR